MGDNAGTDTIRVGDITDVTGLAIGHGATSTVYQGLSITEVADLVAELKRADQPVVWDDRIPFLGLNPFHERDTQFFSAVKSSSTIKIRVISARDMSRKESQKYAKINS